MFGRNLTFMHVEAEDWQLECWHWLLSHTGGVEAFATTPLVLPNADFFPALGDAHGDRRANAIFEMVKRHAQMESWPVTLVAQKDVPSRIGGGAFLEHDRRCAGTFFHADETAYITYSTDQISQPMTLIATFAHELGHYLNGGFPTDPPGGADMVEPATDVTAAFLGFGVFGANDVLNFEQNSESWKGGKTGYLSEEEWVFSLAIFLNLKQMKPEATKAYLKPHLYRWLQKASDSVQKRQLLAQLAPASQKDVPE